jgi:hypothetical protein
MTCPYDVTKNEFLLDDDLAAIFARKPSGARLSVIADCCG